MYRNHGFIEEQKEAENTEEEVIDKVDDSKVEIEEKIVDKVKHKKHQVHVCMFKSTDFKKFVIGIDASEIKFGQFFSIKLIIWYQKYGYSCKFILELRRTA